MINPRYVNGGNGGSVDTLRHEFLHALDTNVNIGVVPASGPGYQYMNDTNQVSYVPKGPLTLDSYQMYPNMTPPQQQQFVNGYGFTPGNPQTDRSSAYEGLAYWGPRGQKVLLHQNLAPYYKNAYIPMSIRGRK